MFLLILIMCIFLNAASSVDPRIVGGEIVKDRSKFAYQVSLRREGEHICGGSIIDEMHVLTAAHCVINPYTNKLVPADEFEIVVGNLKLRKDKNEVVKKVAGIFSHEKFGENLIHDIALIRIVDSLGPFNKLIRPINIAIKTPKEPKTCTVSGWGTMFDQSEYLSDDLRKVEIPLVAFSQCNTSYWGILNEHSVICAGSAGKDSCQGDSGGPLVCDNELAGIVSAAKGCALEGFPGIYTDVSKYVSWIIKKLSAEIDSSTTTDTPSTTTSTATTPTTTTPSTSGTVRPTSSTIKNIFFYKYIWNYFTASNVTINNY